MVTEKREVDQQRQVQQMRNAEFQELERKRYENQLKRREYVEELTTQIQEKKTRVFQSREEFRKDREMVNQVVQKIIQEELE